MNGITIFGRSPAIWLAAITSVLAVLINLPGSPVDPTMAAWIVTVVSALFAVLEAVAVRPVSVSMLTGVVRTVIAATVLFGISVSPELSGAIVAVVTMAFGLFVNANGTPTHDPAPGFITGSSTGGHAGPTTLRG